VWGIHKFVAVIYLIIGSDIAGGRCIKSIKAHAGEIFCSKVDKNVVISGGSDKILRVTDLDTGDTLRSFPHPDSVYL
jgi:hypothetical protein